MGHPQNQNFLNIFSVRELCSFLNISPEKLRWVCHTIESRYRKKIIRKKSGKERKISIPKKTLRPIQKKLKILLGRLALPEYIHTGLKGRSIRTNAFPHARAPVLVQMDIRDFYPSITFGRVLNFFQKVTGLSKDIAWHIAKLTTCEGSVPQGALTSPVVAALIAFGGGTGMAAQLQAVAVKFGGSFSLYGDDASLSGPISSKGQMIISAKKVVSRNGFVWHPDKTKEVLPGAIKTTPGVDVTHGLDVPKEKRKEYKRQLLKLENESRKGKEISTKEIKAIQGKIAYMNQLNRGTAKNYRKRLKKIF